MLLWVLRNEVSGSFSLLGGGGSPVVLTVDLRAILPLGLLHADPVRWHSGSSYAAVGGAHQSDCNPTLDVYTRLQVGLLPLGGQATGYPFQGSRRLHPQHPADQGNEGGEVPTLLEASLQICIFLPSNPNPNLNNEN